jgi:hypothetical protein
MGGITSGAATMATMRRGELVEGRYQLDSVLGKGGMGTVWVARDVRLGRQVAIKFLDTDASASAVQRARFAREARIASRMRNQHVVQVFGDGETSNGIPYVVMELLEGDNLATRIAGSRRRGLEDSEAADVLGRGTDLRRTLFDVRPDDRWWVEHGSASRAAGLLRLPILRVPRRLTASTSRAGRTSRAIQRRMGEAIAGRPGWDHGQRVHARRILRCTLRLPESLESLHTDVPRRGLRLRRRRVPSVLDPLLCRRCRVGLLRYEQQRLNRLTRRAPKPACKRARTR